ncbi:MAG: cytochrome ubiquinol oxidase subunit I, partial [bacterium]
MLFGRDKVGPKLHFFATLMVAVGTLGSAFWILSVNSWMHTPQGHAMNDVGQFVPVDWRAIVFNPSFPYRLVHMVLAAYLTTALVVGAVGGWHLLRDRANQGARTMFSMAMGMLMVVAPLQIVAGDFHGLNTLEYQPAKVAAMEGHFEPHPQGGAPLILFGLPDAESETVRHAIRIPYLSSLILTHDLTSPLPGLKDFPREVAENIVAGHRRARTGGPACDLAAGLMPWKVVHRGRTATRPAVPGSEERVKRAAEKADD